MQKRKAKVIITAPKSDTSARIIPITDFALSLFRMLYHSGYPVDAFVLTGRENKYIESRVLQYRHPGKSSCGKGLRTL